MHLCWLYFSTMYVYSNSLRIPTYTKQSNVVLRASDSKNVRSRSIHKDLVQTRTKIHDLVIPLHLSQECVQRVRKEINKMFKDGGKENPSFRVG